ncbi:uncharacterized protein LOC127800598 isoform X2 [Diospyros lotus]|nr:uncharacterized protein LOC127800598 isoform X2 [Diospyros lotus]XP_052191266.1 uncharacterized protein LOC127800598 isoform X2 [Diospyros lotus]XP_052191267.1 uncharacterized protein LOC127800598 isoform X2 [Diospyros lotus]XP_052191268.1 uncharacterized protein LOC127800598 isoform X2 [Diospyros lotus]
MDSMQLNQNGDIVEGASEKQFLYPDSCDAYNVFGAPELLPRVGDQYQVEIPPLMTYSEYLSYKKGPFELECALGIHYDFLMGLPIPIMWINKEIDHVKHKGLEHLGDSDDISNKSGLSKSESNRKAQNCSVGEDLKCKIEPLDLVWANDIGSGTSADLASEQETRSKMCQNYRAKKYCLVPGSFGGLWSKIEKESFLLGLYIFGKNLVLVKKFIVNKTMGDIQSFYYGIFYKSDEYQRWSDCRKMRSRKCVYGQKIFTGLRQQELLSRLFLNVSEECQKTLSEVSKTFGEGKMPLEEYVFTLKAIVGMNSLVEAVGIGKGKRDLTGITMEPPKSNHAVPLRPEIPIGKACSSLTPEEIIKFLTGDFRLSKARSNDLFWEAVWPRLLARGWHSEQPNDQSFTAASKHSLVFLVPGVKKFSRRRLVKGNHYFDSVSDVLSKVASEPGLLELDTEADESNRNKEECGWSPETKLEQDDLSEPRRHCYLQPRTSVRSTDLMQFTIVDTSLADGKTFKVRELRTLPDEVSKKRISRSHSEENDDDGSEVSSQDSECVDTMLSDHMDTNNSNITKTVSAIGMFSEKDLEVGSSNQGDDGHDPEKASARGTKDLNIFCEDKQPIKSLKCKRGLKQNDLNYLAEGTKRHRRLGACTQAEASHCIISPSVNSRFEQEEQICCSGTPDSSQNNFSGFSLPQRRIPSSSSSKGSPIESSEGISYDTSCVAEGSYDKPQPRTLIDLNLPQVSLDVEASEISIMADDKASKPENSAAPETATDVQQPNMNSRRQGTRNRPPTMRALEAFASGFLTSSRKRKNKEASPRKNSTSRPPKRACSGVQVTENFGARTVDSQMAEVGNGAHDANIDVLNKFQVISEGNDTQMRGP